MIGRIGVGALAYLVPTFILGLSWSFTTIAVAAKNVMSSVPDYLAIETAFTAVQWLIVGPLTAVVFSGNRARPAAA